MVRTYTVSEVAGRSSEERVAVTVTCWERVAGCACGARLGCCAQALVAQSAMGKSACVGMRRSIWGWSQGNGCGMEPQFGPSREAL